MESVDEEWLQNKLFTQVVAALMERGLILKKGTIVDSIFISAPSYTKDKEKKMDSDAYQLKTGNAWFFGLKAYNDLMQYALANQ